MRMDIAVTAATTNNVAAKGWIPCSQELPPPSQFVLYRTPGYEALGKREQQAWYFSGDGIELENGPVLSWRPLN